MKIIVCAKQSASLPNYVALTEDGIQVDPVYLVSKLNEPDAYATEEALRLREAVDEGEVVAVTVGDEEATEALRQCITMGVDRGVRIWSDRLSLYDPISVARALATVIESETPDLILCGVQSTDSGQQSTGPALANVLGLPCVTVATSIEHDQETRRTVVWRELEGGAGEIVAVNGPAVITVQTGPNDPRYGTLREKMRAKNTQFPVEDPGDVGPAHARVRRVFIPDTSQERNVEMIAGGPAVVARRIVELVQEAG